MPAYIRGMQGFVSARRRGFARWCTTLVAAVCATVLVAAPVARAADITVTQDDLVAFGNLGWVVPSVVPPPPDPQAKLINPNDKSPEAMLLQRLIARGTAGGFSGVLYDNRDRGHSSVGRRQFPALGHLKYDDALKENGLDYGLAGRILMPLVVFGNSSTAINDRKIARSQTRLAMTAPLEPQRAFLTYVNNHIYVYPEHRDHDARDRFPANWPYMITTQGSSGSDAPFLRALAMSLAALPSDTRDFLTEQKLVAPTLQMILRRTQTSVRKREAYFTGVAHPVVFDAQTLSAQRMISLASALRPDEVPPMVRLSVESEDFTGEAGLAGLSERLFDTPSAIARVWRGFEFRREMTVSAVNTRDPNGRDLSFRWVLLHGDPDKVQINRLGAAGEKARIRIDWHDTWRVGRGEGRAMDRVDIGVFANNGAHDSAPAIISISFPGHQERVYGPSPSGEGMRLMSVDYTANDRKAFVDPLINWYANWTDVYSYGPDGSVSGWTRQYSDGREAVLLEGAGDVTAPPQYELQGDDRYLQLIEATNTQN